MDSRRLYYRVAARLRGFELETDTFEFSASRAALYYDFMELEKIFERDSVMLLSRSAVLASDEIEFKQQIQNVVKLRDMVDSRIPYMARGISGKPAAETEREEAARRYVERAEKILGKERVQELIKNGKL